MRELSILEQIIMTVIWNLGNNAYGVSIKKRIREIAQKELMYGTLYNSLDQLVRKKFITRFKGEPTPERGGRSKIYYRLSDEGETALKNAYELQKVLWGNIPESIKQKNAIR